MNVRSLLCRPPLPQAVVDVVASSGWLHPALAAMEMCQMVVQGQWEKDSPLLQLPHITPQLAAAAAGKEVSTVFDLIEMEDEDRRELLQVCVCGGGVASLGL
jgi:pre-mRNA-splicing helicase BRR2